MIPQNHCVNIHGRKNVYDMFDILAKIGKLVIIIVLNTD